MLTFFWLNAPNIAAKLLFLYISANQFSESNFSGFLAIQVLAGLIATLGLSGREVMIINGKKEDAAQRLAEVFVESLLISLVLVVVSVYLVGVEQPFWSVVALVISELIVSTILVFSRAQEDNKLYLSIQSARAIFPFFMLLCFLVIEPSYDGTNAAIIIIASNAITSLLVGKRWIRTFPSKTQLKLFRRHATNKLVVPAAVSRIQNSLDTILITSGVFFSTELASVFHFSLAARIAGNVLIVENLQRAFYQKRISNWIDRLDFVKVRETLRTVLLANVILIFACLVFLFLFENEVRTFLFHKFDLNEVFVLAFLAKTSILVSVASGLYLPKFNAQNFMVLLDTFGICALMLATAFCSSVASIVVVVLLVNLSIASLRLARLFRLVRQ